MVSFLLQSGTGALIQNPDVEKLEMYGLFKQAGGGLASETTQPSRINVQARAKWDAWNAVASLPADDARAKYCSLVDRYTSA